MPARQARDSSAYSATEFRPHDLLTIPELCEEFRVTRRQVTWLIETRRVVTYKVGRQRRIRWVDFNNYLESTKTQAVGR